MRYDDLPVPLYALDEQNRVIDANDRYLELLACQRGDVLGHAIFEQTERGGQIVRELVWPRIISTGEARDVDLEFISKTGEVIDTVLCARLIDGGDTPSRVMLSALTRVTARERAEAATRLALEAAEVGAWSSEAASTRLSLSNEARALFGFPVDGEPTLDEVVARLHPEDRDGAKQAIDAALANQGALDIDHRAVGGDGIERWLRISGRVVPDRDGHAARMRGVVVDIDRRKRDEIARNTLAAIVRSSDAAIIGKTLDGTITSWNHGAERMFGWTAEEVVGGSISLLAPPARPYEMSAILDRIRRGERIEHLETERTRKDGMVLQVSLSVSPVHDETGRVVGASKIAQDITPLKQAQAELRTREAQLRSILDTVPDAMAVIDERGVIQTFSVAGERMFGWSAEELRGRNVSVLMPSPHREDHDGYLARYLATGERRIIGLGRLVNGLRKDGSLFPMELAVGEMFVDGRRLFTASSAT